MGLTNRCQRCQSFLSISEKYTTYDRAKKAGETLCFPCYHAICEARMKAKTQALAKDNYISAHRARARKLRLPATLTLEEWNQTKAYFKHKCAYCQIAPIECLEHFVPLELGSGTTKYNCVPACLKCNRYKSGLHPALVTLIPQIDIERVRKYLQFWL